MEDLSYFMQDVQVLVTEEVQTFDEATQQWVVSQSAVYETQQEERPRPQYVQTHDLDRVIGKQPNNDALIDSFVEKNQETEQWVWYDRYKNYLDVKAAVEQWNLDNPEETPRELPVSPVRPPILTPTQWRQNNYTKLRRAAYGSWEEQMELLYDDQVNGTTRFRDAIDAVKTRHPKVV